MISFRLARSYTSNTSGVSRHATRSYRPHACEIYAADAACPEELQNQIEWPDSSILVERNVMVFDGRQNEDLHTDRSASLKAQLILAEVGWSLDSRVIMQRVATDLMPNGSTR